MIRCAVIVGESHSFLVCSCKAPTKREHERTTKPKLWSCLELERIYWVVSRFLCALLRFCWFTSVSPVSLCLCECVCVRCAWEIPVKVTKRKGKIPLLLFLSFLYPISLSLDCEIDQVLRLIKGKVHRNGLWCDCSFGRNFLIGWMKCHLAKSECTSRWWNGISWKEGLSSGHCSCMESLCWGLLCFIGFCWIFESLLKLKN